MNESEFFEILKNKTISGLYVLSGSEEYSKEKAIRQCFLLTNEATRDLNTQTMDSPSCTEVLNVCETLPFFDDKRVVLVQNISAEELNNLIESYDQFPDYSVVIVRKSGDIPQKSPLHNKLSKLNRLVEFKPYDNEHAIKFIDRCAKVHGLSINPGAKSFLINYIGTSLSGIENSLLILDAYVGHGNEITSDTIKTCITPCTESKTYEINDCFLSGNMKKGLMMLQNELNEGRLTIPLFIGFMDKNIKSMIHGFELKNAGRPESEYLPVLNNKSNYVAKKILNYSKVYSIEDLKKILLKILEVDINVKKNGYNDTTAFVNAVCQCFMRCRHD